MLNWEQEPNDNLLKDLILKNPLKRNRDLYAFLKLLEYVPTGASIAIDGKWGTGKTFFVRQLEILINNNDTKRPEKARDTKIYQHIKDSDLLKDCIAIRYDSWENDSDEDPVLSLIYRIVEAFKVNFTYGESKNTMLTIAKFGADIIQCFLPIKHRDFIEDLQKIDSDNPMASIKSTKEIQEKVNLFFEQVCVNDEKRIIIFIDELDRCRPSYAVKLLERIKHYFSNPKVTFVFSVNIDQLQHTVKKFYGADFDANKYLHRFFYITVPLPEIENDKYYQYIGYEESTLFASVCKRVVEYFDFTLRDLQRFFAASKSCAAKIRDNSGNAIGDTMAEMFTAHVIVPVLTGIRINGSTIYFDVVKGRNKKTFVECVSNCIGKYAAQELLNANESYEIESGKTQVLLEDKLGKVYDLLFIETTGGTIGKLVFYSYDNRHDWIQLLSYSSDFS